MKNNRKFVESVTSYELPIETTFDQDWRKWSRRLNVNTTQYHTTSVNFQTAIQSTSWILMQHELHSILSNSLIISSHWGSVLISTNEVILLIKTKKLGLIVCASRLGQQIRNNLELFCTLPNLEPILATSKSS